MKAVLRGIGILSIVTYLFYENIWVELVMIPALIPYIKNWEFHQEEKQKARFRIQFRDYLQSLSTALRTGYALRNAMSEARKELKGQYPESTRIMKDTAILEHLLNMNMPMEQVWREWSYRTEIEELTQFYTIFMVAQKSGGNSVQIIRKAIQNLCEKMEVEAEIQVLLAAKKMEFYIMTVVPIGILVYMKLSFPEFMTVLYGNLLGMTIMTGCLGIYGVAYYLGQRILKIEV